MFVFEDANPNELISVKYKKWSKEVDWYQKEKEDSK